MTGHSNSAVALYAARRTKHHEADVVVVGAGVFGCAMAHAMANQGRSVILLERWMHEPDRIVGELMQPGGMHALRKLGLEDCTEGIDAIPCYGYHVIYHGNDVVIPYPSVDIFGHVQPMVKSGTSAKNYIYGTTDGATAVTEKKVEKIWGSEGRAFHHGRFIRKLREACGRHPNISIFETEVTATIKSEDGGSQVLGVETKTTDKETRTASKDCFFAPLTVIADGYASKFRKDLLGRAPVVKSRFYALELIDCPFQPYGFGHVVIGDAFPVLLYQIGTHETRALIDVPEKLPAASPAQGGVRNYILNVVVPMLPEAIKPSFLAALADGRIPKSMPNSWLPPGRQAETPGVLVLGDAWNMRHPLTGGGMTVALNDVVLAAELLAPERVPSLADYTAVRTAMRDFCWRRKRLTSIINVLAMALYSLFAAQDRQLRALQKGCFAYFRAGFTDEPMGLMGGLIHRPFVLAYHFFRVAFVAMYVNALEVMSGDPVLAVLKAPLALGDAVLILWKACVVFLPVFWAELQ